MPAERAYQLGLVDELAPPDQVMEAAEEIAEQICKNSPAAVSLSMQAVWSSVEMGYTQRHSSTAGRCCACTGTTPTSRKARGPSSRSATPCG